MAAAGNRFTFEIPAEFTVGPHSIQYYFEVRSGDQSRLCPQLDPVQLSNQPYYVVHSDPELAWGRAPLPSDSVSIQEDC